MRKIHLLILFIINSAFCFSQNQDIAIKHFKNKEFLKAAIEFEKLIPIGEYKFGVNSDKVIDYNYLAARSYQESNKLRKAIFFYTQTLQIIEKESKFDSKKSVFHQTIVFYMEALLAYSHEMYLSEEFYNLEQSLIRANNLYIKYNSIKIGKFNAFDKGIELGISKAYALLWGKTGNVIKYKGFTDRTLKLAKEYYGYNSIGYLIELNNSAKAYYDLYLFEESLIFCNELIELYDNNKHDNTILFIANLITKSGNLNKLKRYEEAIETSQNALSLFEKLPQRNRLPDLYGSILQSLGFDYFSLKDYYKSIKYYRMAVDIFEKTYSSQSLKTANLYFNIANSYSNSGDFHLAKGFYLSSLYSTLDNMKNTLFTMTESEKNAYLTFKLNTFFSSINSLAVKYNDSTINETIYNNSLIQKALVLKSTSSIKNRILESNNKQLLLRYEKFLNLKKQLAELYLDENSENEELISSLELKANNLEKGITVESLDYKQYEMKLNADWKDVRSKLSKNEASIEFVNFYYFDKEWTEDIYYCALVLKANSSPEFVFLFKEKDLLSKLEQNSDNNQKSIEALYNKNNGLYELIWKPLENYLQGVSKVHISSSGILHKISFASIKNGDGDYISKKIEISNYYSTADILKKDKTKTIDFKTALLVGGVDYGKQENGWNYLPGTKLEIESINETLNENKIKSEILTNDIATKANFKEKSFNKDIIHIATHGYFIPELSKKESNKIKEYGLVLFDRSINDKRDAFEYNNPLLRSGLVLAESVNNQNLSEKSNSIFYALEVSNLNLFGTDLVILSACETGLGDIKNTDKEGVYGLQRAFKMAGVDNIIVSLWKVPDKETKEFMETFYNNLFIHNDITEAFVSTQKAMSQKYGLYYWGAFVLIK